MTATSAKCPKCGNEMERREGMFYWRGDSRPGYVCLRDNALYVVPGDEIEPLRRTFGCVKNEFVIRTCHFCGRVLWGWQRCPCCK
jgi:ribosomal protein L24E